MTREYSNPFRLPFAGFFRDTEHNRNVNTLLVMSVKADPVSSQINFNSAITWNDHIPRWELEMSYAKAWVSVLARETGLGLVFDNMHAGGRIYATMPLAALESMVDDMSESETADWTALVAADRKTGKSGLVPHPVIFHPPCSRDVGEWGPVATWEQGQHGFLFDFRVWPQIDETVLEDGAVEILQDIIPEVFVEEFRNPHISKILQGNIDKAIQAWDDEHPVSSPESGGEPRPGF